VKLVERPFGVMNDENKRVRNLSWILGRFRCSNLVRLFWTIFFTDLRFDLTVWEQIFWRNIWCMSCRMLCFLYLCFACNVNCRVQVSTWRVEFKFEWIIWISLFVVLRFLCVQQLQCFVVESQDLRVYHLKSSWIYMVWWNVKLWKLWTLSSLRCVFRVVLCLKNDDSLCIFDATAFTYKLALFCCTSCFQFALGWTVGPSVLRYQRKQSFFSDALHSQFVFVQSMNQNLFVTSA